MRSILLCLAASALCAAPGAQFSTTSRNVVSAHSLGGGGVASSTRHVVHGSLGSGAVGQRSSTTRHVFAGGFPTTLDIPTLGAPHASLAMPQYVTLRGRETVTLRGTQLRLGTPTVRVGGRATTVTRAGQESVTMQLPIHDQPGWRPITVTNTGGSHTLVRGVGVLPLLETTPAPASDVPFELVFRGTRGDLVHWAVGVAPSTPIVLPGIHYGFALSPTFFLTFSGLPITHADGTARLRFPATTYPTGSIFVQAMFVTRNAGYGPASFSNRVRL